MELYSEADKTIWEEKYMPVSLKKGQKVSLTKGNPGLKNVVVGIGWDINAFDTGGDFDLDAAAFCLTDSGRVSDSNDFVFYGNLVHPSGAVQHMGDNLTGAGDGDDEQIKINHHLLGLMSFLTSGEDETRAWTIKIGTKAPQAAGKIHTDFERGFIKAEVVNYQDLLDCGSYAGAREKGLVRMEGKEYVVQDGDVILFRFNV